MPTRLDRVGVEFYPDDLLPKMQQLLAILADLDQRYETDRYHLENWSGPQAIKAHLLADLDGFARTCSTQVRIVQIGPIQVGLSKIGPAEVSSEQVSLAQVRPAQIGPAQLGPA